jgi:AcrR family transcriptional regulator
MRQPRLGMKKPRVSRRPATERRKQIVDAVLAVVAEHGVPQTTTARIAAKAGVSYGTLYVYFRDREDMLLAALEDIHQQQLALVHQAKGRNALERIRRIAEELSVMTMTESGGFLYQWAEFVAAGPHEGLRASVAAVQRDVFRALRDVVEEGKQEGTIRPETDSSQLVWDYLGFAWSETMTYLMGLDEYLNEKRGFKQLDQALLAVAVEPALFTSASGRGEN